MDIPYSLVGHLVLLLALNSVFLPVHAKVIAVGPNRIYHKPSEAAKVAEDGDHIQIDSGTYKNDTAVWRQNNLFIYGQGGRPHLEVDGAAAEQKAIWVIKGDNTKIANIEFSGASVADKNGAGIRQEGANLKIVGCYFHDNENGLLAGENPESDIIILHSVFSKNGAGDGQSHNMYIGRVRRFFLKYSCVQYARIGHHVKSRAIENYILYNRIMDENSGESSYSVDLPNGGTSILIGNVIHQGARAQNRIIISYAEEKEINPSNGFYIVNNTIVNDHQRGVYINNLSNKVSAIIVNNILHGFDATGTRGLVQNKRNLIIPQKGFKGFVPKRYFFMNPDIFDYRLKASSPAINSGIDPGTALGVSLTPKWHYLHISKKQKRVISGKIDLGAYEFN